MSRWNESNFDGRIIVVATHFEQCVASLNGTGMIGKSDEHDLIIGLKYYLSSDSVADEYLILIKLWKLVFVLGNPRSHL